MVCHFFQLSKLFWQLACIPWLKFFRKFSCNTEKIACHHLVSTLQVCSVWPVQKSGKTRPTFPPSSNWPESTSPQWTGLVLSHSSHCSHLTKVTFYVFPAWLQKVSAFTILPCTVYLQYLCSWTLFPCFYTGYVACNLSWSFFKPNLNFVFSFLDRLPVLHTLFGTVLLAKIRVNKGVIHAWRTTPSSHCLLDFSSYFGVSGPASISIYSSI